jgi:ATP-dependent DNA helicase RecG
MDVATPLEKIKGVGEKTTEQFALAGLNTVGDLINFLPRTYEDYSNAQDIAHLKPGKVTVRARCSSINTKFVRRGMKVTNAVLSDNTGSMQAVWFNQPYRETQLKTSQEFFFTGSLEFSRGRYQLMNPGAEVVKDTVKETEGVDRVVPVYRAIRGLKTQLVRKIMNGIRPVIETLPETLPSKIVASEELLPRSRAVAKMHFPANFEDVEQAKERLAFEELFQLLLASQLNKQENAKLKGWNIPFDQPAIKEFVSKLPFALTNAQRIASWEIIQDFQKDTPMNRLLQGDVGAGKTVVAGIAARQAAVHGFQTALMAPTEILANQHAKTLSDLLEPFGITVGLLTSGVKGESRKMLYQSISDGTVDVLVGTHALIQTGVEFASLGFVVIDEQHRFGVAQRQELLKKSKNMPHMLAMTATPIPRSLALTVYGELDISVLDELPANRKPIKTKIWSPNSRPQLYELIDKEIAGGRQVYVVCSLVDDSVDNELKSVQAEYRRLQNSVFKHRKIGLLHGQMKSSEKDEVMGRFSRGEIDVLVSTTVIEVGVDVPNATAMIIEDADRFGLAQLHQLRGRVGRGEHQSYCYLVTSTSAKPSRRLKEIETSNDGFYLAEVDLELRGPGEIYGRSQHGALNLQVASLADTRLIARAKRSAKQFVEEDSLDKYKELSKSVVEYQRLTTLN